MLGTLPPPGPDGRLMAVPVRMDPDLDSGDPEVVLEQAYYAPARPRERTYDVSPDGERFMMIKEGGGEAPAPEIILVQNWFEELKRLVPTNR